MLLFGRVSGVVRLLDVLFSCFSRVPRFGSGGSSSSLRCLLLLLFLLVFQDGSEISVVSTLHKDARSVKTVDLATQASRRPFLGTYTSGMLGCDPTRLWDLCTDQRRTPERLKLFAAGGSCPRHDDFSNARASVSMVAGCLWWVRDGSEAYEARSSGVRRLPCIPSSL